MASVGLGQISNFSFLYSKAFSVVKFSWVLSLALVIETVRSKRAALNFWSYFCSVYFYAKYIYVIVSNASYLGRQERRASSRSAALHSYKAPQSLCRELANR